MKVVILVFAVAALLPRAAGADEVRLDPVGDSVVIAGGVVVTGVVSLIARTGGIEPTQPGDAGNLFFLDRHQAEGSLEGTERLALASQYLWYSALAAGGLWPIVTGLEHGNHAGWDDVRLYAESISLTAAITQTVRIMTLRPRPSSYIRARHGSYDRETAETDSSMSFFSGHVAGVAAVGSTMTYLELLRNPDTARPWLAMGSWAAATAAMAYLRVAARRHFVTDVLTGVLVGVAVGTLVPHLHRSHDS